MTPGRFASRAGEKLAAALAAFDVAVSGLVCADFGSHVGGFVDCLLAHGAARVYAVEPGYGVLDYRLRKDPRVVVCERTNALHFQAPEPISLLTCDVGWTPQRLVLPAAQRQLAPGGRVISLVKPQYEAPPEWRPGGVVSPDRVAEVLAQVRTDAVQLGWQITGEIESPIRGHGGNVEFLWLLVPRGR